MSKTIEEILVPKPEARPRIYAYSIGDAAHQGLLKVGQTTRDVKHPHSRGVAPIGRSAAFMPLHRPHAPPVSNTKVSSTLKRHKCRAPPPLRGFGEQAGRFYNDGTPTEFTQAHLSAASVAEEFSVTAANVKKQLKTGG